MISAADFLECLKSMTQKERREVVSLLIPSFADMPDFRPLDGLSLVQANQYLSMQPALASIQVKEEAGVAKIGLSS